MIYHCQNLGLKTIFLLCGFKNDIAVQHYTKARAHAFCTGRWPHFQQLSPSRDAATSSYEMPTLRHFELHSPAEGIRRFQTSSIGWRKKTASNLVHWPREEDWLHCTDFSAKIAWVASNYVHASPRQPLQVTRGSIKPETWSAKSNFNGLQRLNPLSIPTSGWISNWSKDSCERLKLK